MIVLVHLLLLAFGSLGILFGLLAKRSGKKTGKAIAAVNGACLLCGLLVFLYLEPGF